MKQVLDKGFVRLVDHMGTDGRIVQSARVSYGEGTKTVRQDQGLIDFLTRHKHTSPLEQVEFVFHLKIPLFVFGQLVRHRTASLNAQSARYSVMKDEFYIPKEVRTQDDYNKQGSVFSEDADEGDWFSSEMEEHTKLAYGKYQEYLNRGVAREIARMVLPQNLYTELYWKQDLHNLLHLLRLRLDDHAQWEIRQYAQAMYEYVKDITPWAVESWEEHTLHSLTLSRTEQQILSDTIEIGRSRNEPFSVAMNSILDNLVAENLVSKGRAREIREKLLNLLP